MEERISTHSCSQPLSYVRCNATAMPMHTLSLLVYSKLGSTPEAGLQRQLQR